MIIENLFKEDGLNPEEELVEILVSAGEIVRLERVISSKSDVASRVYDQKEDEFVVVVKGYAELEFERDGAWEYVSMSDGDYINIPAHLKHRVTKTEEGTLWLCLFYKR